MRDPAKLPVDLRFANLLVQTARMYPYWDMETMLDALEFIIRAQRRKMGLPIEPPAPPVVKPLMPTPSARTKAMMRFHVNAPDRVVWGTVDRRTKAEAIQAICLFIGKLELPTGWFLSSGAPLHPGSVKPDDLHRWGD